MSVRRSVIVVAFVCLLHELLSEAVHCSTVVVHGYITYVIRLLNEAFFMFTEGCSALLTKATGHDLPHVQPWL